MFIVVEGLDGCGKTTQTKAIRDWLIQEGKKTLLTGEPSNNQLGLFLREVLIGTQKTDPKTLALLFTADRYWHLEKEVKPALEEGKIVVMERYVNSTIAYQTAQEVDGKWIRELNRFAIKPDLTLFMDMKPEIATQRADSGEIFENMEFQEKVYQEYIKIGDMIRIDANKTREQVFHEIKAVIEPRLGK
ncbi:MAG: dTMP kinase [Candidatus Altiarchaeales archaeon ex4484_2]|nr:MAG: dTMP kinase [Candidatus Altiarchaeales archaeon ex4484_2]